VREQLYSLAADAVVVFHFAWILFLAGGFLIGRRVRWMMWLHISGLVYSILLQIFSWICPLTYLEVWLRDRAGSGFHSESFIAHYLEKIIYLEVPPSFILFLTLLVIGISAAVYSRAIPMGR
jgi:Protein of Unknown function (DUF2784)